MLTQSLPPSPNDLLPDLLTIIAMYMDDPIWFTRLERVSKVLLAKLRSQAAKIYWQHRLRLDFPATVITQAADYRQLFISSWQSRKEKSQLSDKHRKLFNLIRRGDLENIQKSGYTLTDFLDCHDEDKLNPLLFARRHNWMTIVTYIFAKIEKAFLNGSFQDKFNYSILHWAAACGLLPKVNCYLQKIDVNDANNNGCETPLFVAAAWGEAEVVRLLIAAKADVSRPDHYFQSPLFIASKKGHLTVVNLLLAAKASVDEINISCQTPLFIAAQEGHAKVVAALLPHADPLQPEIDLCSALSIAAKNKHTACVEILAGAKAHINYRDLSGTTALYYACSSKDTRMVKALLSAEAAVNAVDNFNTTPLHVAAGEDNLENVNLLLTAGADVHVTTRYHQETALHLAAKNGRVEIACALLAAGANINQGENGSTPVMTAMLYRKIDVLNAFIARATQVTLATIKAARRTASNFKQHDHCALLDLWVIKIKVKHRPIHEQVNAILSAAITRKANDKIRFFNSTEIKIISVINNLLPDIDTVSSIRAILIANRSAIAPEKFEFLMHHILSDNPFGQGNSLEHSTLSVNSL